MARLPSPPRVATQSCCARGPAPTSLSERSPHVQGTPPLPACDGSCMCLNKSPLAGFLPGAQEKKGSGANTRTQLSFKLTSNPPPRRDTTRCVGAYDQPNSGGFAVDSADICGKPKSGGLRDASAAVESLAARSNSPAQSMGGRMGLPSSLGGTGLGSTGGDGVAFRRTDRRERGSGCVIELSGTAIDGAIHTN